MIIDLPNAHINQATVVTVDIGDSVTCVIWDFAYVDGIVASVTNTSITVKNANAYNFVDPGKEREYRRRKNAILTFLLQDLHSLKVKETLNK
jgi:hypothetical protein